MTQMSQANKPVNDLSKQSDEFIKSMFESFIVPKIQLSK